MLFRNKDMTWKSVSDFTLEKCNESLMDGFIEDIDLDEITPEEIEKMLQEADKIEVNPLIAFLTPRQPASILVELSK